MRGHARTHLIGAWAVRKVGGWIEEGQREQGGIRENMEGREGVSPMEPSYSQSFSSSP